MSGVGGDAGLAIGSLPPGVRLLGPPGSNHPSRGNLVFHCSDGGTDAVLKVYRWRRGRWRGRLGDFAQRWIEGKRGSLAARRRETERAALSTWGAQGFGAPRLLDRARPAWIGDHPALWMEFVEGETLRDVLGDPERSRAEGESLVAQFAAESGRRHRRALDLGETLLVQEHPAVQHVMVSSRGLVTFDLENAYAPGFPVLTALAQELSATLRSLRVFGERLFETFVASYGEPDILQQSCGLFLSGSLRWRIYRGQETARRGAGSKTETMRRLAAHLDSFSSASRSAGSRSPSRGPGRCG